MMTEEQRRFEQWAAGIYDTRLLKDEKGNYCGQVLQQLWQAWQDALTQPASPALKLPETISVRKAIAALDNASAVTTIAQSYKMAWNSCIAETKRLNAPHTAPIEPICATGGVKVPEGWSLVPNEATRQMIEEGDQWELSENIWNAMRGVAPKL